MAKIMTDQERENRQNLRRLLRRSDSLTVAVSDLAEAWGHGFENDEAMKDRLIDAWGFLQEATGILQSVLDA